MKTHHLNNSIKIIAFLSLSLLINMEANGQMVTVITEIQPPAIETSGLIRIDGRTITHNDSGGDAALFEIDTLSGNINRVVEILGANNIDWEAICTDDTFIYIGDFGNNQGNRTNLKIYKVLLADYLDQSSNSVNSETISFIYEDQNDFTPSQFTTNFDAEGFIVKNEVLYIFTKNWGNNWTNIYELPTTPGSYVASRIDSINTEGMITDATYSEIDDKITLVGYTIILNPFLFEIENIGEQLFSESELIRTDLTFPTEFSRQAEGISQISDDNFILSAEEGITGNAALFKLSITEPNSVLEKPKAKIRVYPNPASDYIFIQAEERLICELLDMNGRIIKKSKSDKMNLKGLPAGPYLISIQDLQGNELKREKIVVQ